MSAKKKAPIITATSHDEICDGGGAIGVAGVAGVAGADDDCFIVVEEGIAAPTLGPGEPPAEMDMGIGDAAAIDIGEDDPVSTGMTLLVVRRVGGMVSIADGAEELVPGDSDDTLALLPVLARDPLTELSPL